jgi:hypothetical protein
MRGGDFKLKHHWTPVLVGLGIVLISAMFIFLFSLSIFLFSHFEEPASRESGIPSSARLFFRALDEEGFIVGEPLKLHIIRSSFGHTIYAEFSLREEYKVGSLMDYVAKNSRGKLEGATQGHPDVLAEILDRRLESRDGDPPWLEYEHDNVDEAVAFFGLNGPWQGFAVVRGTSLQIQMLSH